MSLFYISFGIAVFSSVLYHVFQKAISQAVNPILSLMVTYAIAFLLSIPLFVLFPIQESVVESLRKVNWATFALSIAIIGLEAGFLLAYRAGWNLGTTGIAANTASALLLLPIGILLFKEKPSLINIVGVFVCIIGLVMVSLRK